jgi:hypothetical protein
MTNPSGLVFPKENNSYPFEHIKIGEREKLEAFVNRKQPDWARPPIQHILDILMAATFILLACGAAALGGTVLVRAKRGHNKQDAYG